MPLSDFIFAFFLFVFVFLLFILFDVVEISLAIVTTVDSSFIL